jgi:thiol-disulfide isomerase/thioredoxin
MKLSFTWVQIVPTQNNIVYYTYEAKNPTTLHRYHYSYRDGNARLRLVNPTALFCGQNKCSFYKNSHRMKITTPSKSVYVIIAMVIVLVAGLIYILSIDESDVQKRNQTDAAQALVVPEDSQSFTDTLGVALTLDDYLGEVVVVTSWASWCPQCATDLPLLAAIADDYTEREVVFLAINRSESLAMAERFLNTLSSRPDLQFIMDPSDHFFNANEGYAMPETVVYDQKGSIVLQQRGELREAELRSVLDGLDSE